MIPKILHSRSQLTCHINVYDDGKRTIFVLADTYPELLDLHCGDVVKKSPTGWRTSSGGKMRYLWFPADSLDEDDLQAVEEWKEHFEQYVLIGLNKHLTDHFADELDFCLALDFRYDPDTEKRTIYGEAEYQLKYKRSRPSRHALQAALVDAFEDLPIPVKEEDTVVISCIPSDPEERNVGRELAMAVAASLELKCVQADLLCDKSAMKNLTVAQKIPEWKELYDREECIKLQGDVRDKTVVIVDDLYQSGATMWCFAKYLKDQGAKYVLGLPCVKSLTDTDNQ